MTNNQEPLDVFINQLLEEKGINKLDPEIVDQARNDLYNRVENTLNAVIVQHMPEEKLEEFNKLLDEKSSDDDIHRFCQENITNIDEVFAEALISFRLKYLSAGK